MLPDSWGKAATIALIDAREDRYASAIDEIVAYIEEGPSITAHMQEEPAEILAEPRNPYKGLRAFTQDDTADFFGRETLIEEMVETTKEMLTVKQPAAMSVRLLTLTGPSGSGKSSVVMAGLLPRLQSGALSGSEAWSYLVMVPGQHPIESLVLTLAPHLPTRSLTAIREDLEDDSSRGLHLLATQLKTKPDLKLVLLVDQFEEVFAQTVTEEERQRFIDLLVTAATEPHGSVLILLTLRADFSDRPMHYPAFYRLMQTQTKAVLPMEMPDLHAIIERPASLPDVKLTFEGNLVGDLLFESLNQPGALPLLEFTLDQLFQMREGHELTLEAYKQLGGVKGALTKHAEATYASLPSEEHRTLARTLFLRLLDPGASELDTRRRRAALSELSLAEQKQTAIIQEVVDAFIAARLLTTNKITGTTTVEVSHEALIREWPRLIDWLDKAREDIRLQQVLDENIVAWQQRGQPKDRLYQGSQLSEAKAWARRNIPSRDEVTFLRACAARRMRYLASVMLVLLLLLSTTVATGWYITHQPPDPRLVTNLQNDGTGSLRWAIANAPSGSTITFDQGLWGHAIRLTSQLLINDKGLSIRGPGRSILTINCTEGVHVFSRAAVSISGLTFNGSLLNPYPLFDNEGRLTLTNSTISDDSYGLADSIRNEQQATLTLTNSTVSDNSTIDGTGGIDNNGTLTLTNSTVSDNSTINGSGGGMTNFRGEANITFCTIYSNSAPHGIGGGILIRNGISAEDVPSSQVTLRNSIIADNLASTGPDISGTLITDGYNLIQNTSGITFNDPHNKHTTDILGSSFPNLGLDPHLQDNGGSIQPHTWTHKLLQGNPAIDVIPLDACLIDGKPSTDQRGVKRPEGSKCDIGAYELST